jgi:ABC-type uncharacterized transport system substrate-binding protein
MKKNRTIQIIVFTAVFFVAGSAWADTKRVYIAASYEKTHVCGWPQEQGVIKGLNKEGWFEGINLEVKRFYMDTKRKNTKPEAMKRVAAEVISEIDSYKPHVLVTLDDNAFREVGLQFAGRQDIAVVFSGMNGQPENYNSKKPYMNSRENPGGNITGVYEKLYVVRSVRVMERAVPGLKGSKIVGITDYSPTGNAITKQFELELAKKQGTIDWELVRVKDWKEYVDLIARINSDDNVKAIYPVALTLKVSETETYTAPEIFKWTVKNSKKPEMALNYFFAKVGLFGGAAVDFKAMGFLAGKKTGKVLNGEKVADLSIDDAPEYAIVFNVKRAKRLSVEIPAPLLTAADYVYRE